MADVLSKCNSFLLKLPSSFSTKSGSAKSEFNGSKLLIGGGCGGRKATSSFHHRRPFSVQMKMGGSGTDIKARDGEPDSKKFRDLWVQCENCYGLNYKKNFKSKMNICEHCGHHLKMSSSERIELLIDPGTWDPMDEEMVSMDPIGFHSEDEPYRDRYDAYQRMTGLAEAVQTGIGHISGIPVAIGVMDFQFMGGSMGSVVGEKITRLIENAANQSLPVILVCASGGARMQEGSLSLMQMAKISCALHYYQSEKKLFYVAVLTSPTTGGVTASFAMLGDIIIAEPNAYIAFAGKRVIEQTLNKTVPDGSQSSEALFQNGLLDSIVPRSILKGVLSELLQLHGFLPAPASFEQPGRGGDHDWGEEDYNAEAEVYLQEQTAQWMYQMIQETSADL
ncbi:hypothetical protein QJS04_geneDACA016198 [Acorus gramineus]|uniref:CoA carboxyltransferase N-terminal domain-containing protein n=1 Tax=Acorus gramineus TaxID=55184 RepID=A0AAV9B4T3_ACOGR|nr:hypothetical protein QJS04_geneDACA016198 [Acorus gramineus]